MTPESILEELKRCGAAVEVVGDKLRCRAPVGVLTPELRQALAAQKAALLRLLAPQAQDERYEPPCPGCGASDWRDAPDAGRWCLPCVIAGRVLVVAVKIWSDTLEAPLWVVADDLPHDQWPQDAPVYTHAEVRRLQHQPPDVLRWVHVAKQEFGYRAVDVRGPQPGIEGTDHAA